MATRVTHCLNDEKGGDRLFADKGWKAWGAFFIAALLGFLAIKGDSLWIDEANSASVAMAPDVASWWRALMRIPSDVQISGYFFQLWGWEKMAGSGEWALRLNNFPWFLGSLIVWFIAMPRRWCVAMMLLMGLSPFLWYYVSEIRPYMMVFCGSSLMAAALFRALQRGFTEGWLWCFGVGCLIAASASSSSIPWVGTAMIAALFLLAGKSARFPAYAYRVIGLLAIPGVLLIGVYAWSFLQGARAASPEATSLASLAFIPYEMLGFAGLGPGRAELRIGGVTSLKPFLLPLSALFVFVSATAIAGIRSLIREAGARKVLLWGALFLLPLVAVVALGLLSGLRTTGRHLTSALPFILPVLAIGVGRLWNGWLGRSAVIGLFATLAVSCFVLRTDARHAKENYREAAARALEAVQSGKWVWWLADACGAEYYRLPLVKADEPGAARWIVNAVDPPQPLPDVVVYSRADVYDNQGTIAQMLKAEGYQPATELQGFVIWERP